MLWYNKIHYFSNLVPGLELSEFCISFCYALVLVLVADGCIVDTVQEPLFGFELRERVLSHLLQPGLISTHLRHWACLLDVPFDLFSSRAYGIRTSCRRRHNVYQPFHA